MTKETNKTIEKNETASIENNPSRKAVIASAVCSGLRYASVAALSGVFIAAGMGHHLKDIAIKMLSPHEFWMPATKGLANAFAFISIGLGLTSIAEFFAKCAKNARSASTKEDQPVREWSMLEEAGVAIKTIYNLGLAAVSTAAAYYSVKFIALFAKAAVALKGHHLMSALKNTGKALNMSSVFSNLFAAVGIAHAVKGLFKTCATAFHYVKRKGQENRPSGKKLVKQSVKTSLKVIAAVGGVLCASVPVIGWALLGAASLALTVWSVSKIWRSKKVPVQAISRESSTDSMSVVSALTDNTVSKDVPAIVANANIEAEEVKPTTQKPVKLAAAERSSTVWREGLPYVPAFNGCSVSPVL